jgi:hypothetical protein
LSKGGEVGEVEGLFSLDQTLHQTLDLCVRLVVEKQRVNGPNMVREE